MLTFPLLIKNGNGVVVELGITVRADMVIVRIETPDGEDSWWSVSELVRLGYAEKLPWERRADVYRLRRDRCRSPVTPF